MNQYLARLNAKIHKKPLPKEPSKPSKPPFEGFEGDQGRRISDIERPPEPDQAELEERKGMAMESVPERYLDAWARFQLQCPDGVTEQAGRQAIDDTGRFLDKWGKLADSFGWALFCQRGVVLLAHAEALLSKKSAALRRAPT
jgi:hypothetical protein